MADAIAQHEGRAHIHPSRNTVAREVSRAASIASRLKGPALWLAAGVFVATGILWLLDIDRRFEAAIVNLVSNITFIGIASGLIAVISARGFLRTGAWSVLWLGAGSLAFGIAVSLSSVFLTWANVNAAITMHNSGALLAGGLHCLGAFFASNRIAVQEPGPWRRDTVRQVYTASLIVIAVVAAGAVFGKLPPFFVQGEGGTALRQLVVVLDAALFLIVGLAFLRQYASGGALLVYWYALGLLLSALGLAGILMINATGTPLNWMGRAAQWLGGLYLLMAALVTLAEARARQLHVDEVLAGYFLGREANLNRLFESISDAVIVTDETLRVSGWNRGAATVYGWAPEEATGQPVAELLRTEYPTDADRRAAEQALRSDGVVRLEVVQHHRDGRRLTVLATISVLKDDLGHVIGTVAINRDITARREAEEEIKRLNATLAQRATELEASNRELEAFAYSVSHDLRAPLRGIDGFSQALQEDCADQLDEMGKSYLRMLRSNAQRMGQLIDDLLALSRVGRQQLQPQPVVLAELVARAWEDLRAQWAGRAVELRVGDLLTCEADAALLKQVFLNLLDNALKFSSQRTPALIEVGCVHAEGRDAAPVYFVKDNGVGFDGQYADRIFGVFQRLHRAEEYPGTGVGLAIVQRVIQRHGGRVWAEGQPDAGATFYFTLGGACSDVND